MAENTVEVGFINKKDDLKIRAALTKYKNELYIDIREFLENDTYQGPTKRGVRFHSENWEIFYELMQKIDQELKKRA